MQLGMGCGPSASSVVGSPRRRHYIDETIVQAYVRMDISIAQTETSTPAARLAVILPLLQDLQQELIRDDEASNYLTAGENQEDSMLPVILDLKLSQDNPQLAAEHEEFVANINRQGINKLNRILTESRFTELTEKKKELETEVETLQLLYKEQDHLLESVLGEQYGSAEERGLEARAGRERALRDTLAGAARAWRGARGHAARAHAAAAPALLAWQLVAHSSSAAEAVRRGLEARAGLVAAAAAVRAAHAALPAAPFPHCTARQMQALLLTVEYMFTDMHSPERYKHATRVFSGFSDRTLALATWISDVLKTTLDKDVQEIEDRVAEISKQLRQIRVNLIAEKGLTDIRYKRPKTPT